LFTIFSIPLRVLVHYGLHLLAPGVISYVMYREQWKKAWLIMLSTMLIDLDHLLANPVYDPMRASIGFHPLHTWQAMLVYMTMIYFPETRILGIGLFFHIITDTIDAGWMMLELPHPFELGAILHHLQQFV
jgi:hypothetical protein